MTDRDELLQMWCNVVINAGRLTDSLGAAMPNEHDYVGRDDAYTRDMHAWRSMRDRACAIMNEAGDFGEQFT